MSFRNLVRAFSSRSLAARLFFSGQLKLLQGAANGRYTHPPVPLLPQHGLAFGQRHIRIQDDRVPQHRPIGLGRLRADPPPCRGVRSSPARCRRSIFLTNVMPTLKTRALPRSSFPLARLPPPHEFGVLSDMVPCLLSYQRSHDTENRYNEHERPGRDRRHGGLSPEARYLLPSAFSDGVNTPEGNPWGHRRISRMKTTMLL